MRARLTLCAAASCLLVAQALIAQAERYDDTLTLVPSATKTVWSGAHANDGKIQLPATGGRILLLCPSVSDCAKLSAAGSPASLSGTVNNKQTPSRVLVVAPGADSQVVVQLKFASASIAPPLTVTFTGAGSSPKETSATTDNLLSLVNADCPLSPGDTSDFVVRPDGQVLARRLRALNEGDVVVVTVVGDKQVVGAVKVVRSTSIRVVSVTNNYGAGTNVSSLIPQAIVQPSCDSRTFPLTDFAPGKAQFDITISSGSDGSALMKSTVEFNVDALYTGVFLLGGMGTTARNPSFGKVFNGSDSVVSQGDAGSRFLYLAAYSPFIWGARDLTQSIPADRLYERLNPMIGVVLNDVTNNAVVGVSIDLSHQIYLLYGLHAARVNQIDPSSGLRVGGTAAGFAVIPTVRHWTFKPFYGVAIDVQTAASFFEGILGMGGKS